MSSNIKRSFATGLLSTASLLLVLSSCSTTITATTHPAPVTSTRLTSTPATTSQITSPTSTSTNITARKDITVAEAAAMIDANKGNPDFVLIDVRTPEEYAAGRIAGSLNVDYEATGFRDEVDKLDKAKSYLVYCRTGVRSAAASDVMAGLDFHYVYNMTGGITAWQAAGYPVEQP